MTKVPGPVGDAVLALRRRRQASRRWLDQFYAREYDPYHSIDDPYEAEKYADILRSTGGRRYGRALEVGCAVGTFTKQLAGRCDELVAMDISETAVGRTRERVAGLPHVSVVRGTAPAELPPGLFDLVVCSDVLYYLTQRTLQRALDALQQRLAPGGTIVSLHWLGDFGVPTSGDQVHDEQERRWSHLQHTEAHRRTGVGPEGAGYRLDRYDRV